MALEWRRVVLEGVGVASTELIAPTRYGSGDFVRSSARRQSSTRSLHEEACGAPRRWLQGGHAHQWWIQGMPVLRWGSRVVASSGGGSTACSTSCSRLRVVVSLVAN